MKEVLGVVRELAVLVVVALLVFWPAQVGSRLARMGFVEVDAGGLKLKLQQAAEDTKKATATVAQLTQESAEISDELKSLANHPIDAKAKASIEELSAKAAEVQGKTAQADTTLRTSLIRQQDVMERLEPAQAARETTGWIYLGKVEEAKQQWAAGSPETVRGVSVGALTPGARLTIVDDVYLRGDAASQRRNQSAVIRAIPAGDSVEVLAPPEFSHARAGGWFVWVKVKRVQS